MKRHSLTALLLALGLALAPLAQADIIGSGKPDTGTDQDSQDAQATQENQNPLLIFLQDIIGSGEPEEEPEEGK